MQMKNSDVDLTISLDGKKVSLTNAWSDSYLPIIQNAKPDTIALGPGDWKDSDFLLKLKDYFTGLYIGDESVDWKVVSKLSKIQRLEIGGWFHTNMDFGRFNELIYLGTYWNEGYKDDFYGLPKLKSLKLRGWKENTAKKLIGLKKLEFLELLECGALSNLCGLEGLSKLRGVEFNSLPKLTDISALTESTLLESAIFDNCKKIQSFSALSGAKNLKQLIVARSSNIESIEFLREMKSLVHVSFGNGTTILDGDLSPLLDLPKLQYCRFTGNKSYSHTQSQILKMKNIDNDPSIIERVWEKPIMRV